MIGLMKICFLKGLQVLCSTLCEEQVEVFSVSLCFKTVSKLCKGAVSSRIYVLQKQNREITACK